MASIEPNSPASQAGLREADIIIGLAGEEVRGIDQLHRLLTEERIGVETPIVVIRSSGSPDTQELVERRRPERLELTIKPADSLRRAA